MSAALSPAFGTLLRQLRKRAGMTQRDLAAALGYTDSLISGLETGQRQPDLAAILPRFVPGLGLQDDPAVAQRLYEWAAAARGEQPNALGNGAIPTGREARHPETPSAIPALPVELIGREEMVNQLSNRLLGHGGRLLTLLGPPGVGKTSLALSVAARIQHLYEDGACFVFLAAVSDPALMAATILAQVAPGDGASLPPQKRLIQLLRRKTFLLVLDNLEQLPDAASLIAGLLAECPGLMILATSRERLHLRAEQRCKVPPLALAPAVELFVQRAQAVDSAFCLDNENRLTVAAICTRLDCLPLALELCAAQVDLFTPTQLLKQTQARPLDLLVDGAQDLPAHQRTLRGAIQRSYELLGAEEKRLFRRLGVFAGGFALVAVEGIGDWELGSSDAQSPVSILRSLAGKSLVRVEGLAEGEQRFFLLETIREFALEQLQLWGEEESARQRHYEIYLRRFRSTDTHLRGPDAPVWFARLQAEHDNLRAAIRWALDAGRYEETAWLILATGYYCRLRGHWYEELGWHQELLPHRHLFDIPLRLGLLLKLFSVASVSDADAMLQRYAGELIELGEKCSVQLLRSAAWARFAIATADFAQASAAWEKAMALVWAAQDAPGPGYEFGVNADYPFIFSATAGGYAAFLIDHGQYTQAASLLRESLAASASRGYVSGVGASLGTLGRLALLQGDLHEARTLLQQAVTTIKASIHPSVLAKIQPHLAVVTLYENDPAGARRLLMESLAIWTNIRETLYLARLSIYLAETALWEGKIPEAEGWLAQCVEYRVDPGRIGIALVNCFLVAARLAVARQHYSRAATLFGLAEKARANIDCTLVEPVRAQVGAAVATVQAALGPSAFAADFEAGEQLSPAEAFTALLSAPAPATPDSPVSTL